MAVQSINYGAVQTAYVSSISYTLDEADQHLDLVWPTPYTTATDILAATNNFTVTAVGCSINLANANEVSLGMNIYIRNVDASTQTFSVNDNTGTLLQTIDAATTWWFQLIEYSNDTGGTWAIIEQGAGTSQATAAALAGHGLEAVDAKLDTVIPPSALTIDYTITEDDKSKIFIINSSGERTIILGGFSGGFTVSFNNIGAGVVNFVGTVNNIDNFSLASSQTVTLINDAVDTTKWWSLGLGQGTNFVDSVLNKDLTSIAGGGTLVLSFNELNNFIHQFYSDDSITGDIIIYYGTSSGNWYISNFCETSNGSTISLSAGTASIPLGDPIELPMGEKFIAYLANQPILDSPRLFVTPTTSSLTTILLEDGSAGSPSLSFISNDSSGMYLEATNVPAISAQGQSVLFFNGTQLNSPYLEASYNAADNYPVYTFNTKDTFGMGTTPDVLTFHAGQTNFRPSAYLSYVSGTPENYLTISDPTTSPSTKEIAIGTDATSTLIQTSYGGFQSTLRILPVSANQTKIELIPQSTDGSFSITQTATGFIGTVLAQIAPNNNCSLLLSGGAADSSLTLYNPVNPGSTIISKFNHTGGYLEISYADGGATGAIRISNTGGTDSILTVKSPNDSQNLILRVVNSSNAEISYAGQDAFTISNANGAVTFTQTTTFTQRATTLTGLMPTATLGDLIYYNGTAWVVISIGSEGDTLKVSGGIPAWVT